MGLIEDAKKFNFNPSLLQKYEKQLSKIQKELQEIKDNNRRLNVGDKNRSKNAFNEQPEPTADIPKKKEIDNLNYSFPNLPEGEKIFINCSKCKRPLKRKTMEDNLCNSCKDITERGES